MLDKAVLSISIAAKEKKDDTFKERVNKLYSDYITKKQLYENALHQIHADLCGGAIAVVNIEVENRDLFHNQHRHHQKKTLDYGMYNTFG